MYQMQSPHARQEAVLFTGHGVQVTSARFVCYQQTYPLGGITSVTPFTIPPDNGSAYTWVVLFALMSVGSLAITALCVVAESSGGAGFFGLMMIGAAGLAALCIVTGRGKKPTHGVQITTAGMNVRALTSVDLAFVQNVVGALNQALAMR